MKKYIKLFLAMTLVIISMFSSARLNTTSALGATGAINITGQSITPTKSPVDQYTDINVNMNFSVPSTAKTGGQAIISLPKNLKFVSDTNFNVMSSDNKIVAKAVLNAASKTITLTYTDYVTKKSDIKGSLFFNVRVSPDTASPSKVPINISVNNKNIPIGNVDFVVDPGKSDKVLDKVSWNTKKLADGGITRDYEVRVNAENKPLTNAIVLDKLNTDGMSYVKDSFVVKKGTWAVNSNLKLELKNATVVSVPVNFDASQKSFQVNLGNVAANEGYSIYYKVKIDKTPKNGQQFLNNVTLKADKVTETKNNPFVYQNAGGEAEGYNYSVKIKKVDSETNAALAGASFDVIRTSTNETVKSVTTDANGEALIDGLLNTEYKLVETKAPEGYQLNKEAIVVKTTDFNTSKVALKTISNKKIPKEPTPTNATIELDKQLSGRDLVNGEFKFVLKDDQGNQVGSEATNQNGKITFPSIKFEKEGTYNYTVKEVKGENNTINYDKSEKHITINVTKDGNNLKAEVVYQDGKTFNNTFTPNATNASIELDKKLDGRDLVDGEFSFDLYEGSNKLQTVTNKNGKVAFDSISYKEVGEHTYTIKEVKGDNSTITYDESEKQVTVKVTRDGDNLKTEVVYPESKTFINKFTPNEAKATIELEKQLAGRNLADGEFSFDLYEGSNKLQTTTNKNGKVTFDSISYKEVGEHTYTVKEVKGTDSTIAYDESEKHVTVKVTRDGDNLKTEVVYPESKVFHNLFTPNATSAEFSLKKNLSGRDLKDGEFTFTLFDSEGKAVKTVSNDANGNILFNGLIFSKEGRYTYKVVENKNNVEGITYDEVARTVTIDVKLDKERGVLTSVVELPENKVFNNSYKPTTPPKGILPRTGIGALSSSIAGLGILSLVGLAIRRKQKMN